MDFLVLLPPIVAIILALWTKDVIISLFSGIFLGELLLKGFDFFGAFIGVFERLIALFSEGWITKTVLFALLVGAILRLIVASGGVDGFIAFLQKQNVKSKKGSLLLAYIIGIVIFIESSITSLIAGAVARPMCERYGVSREKLAYVCDSTSAPVCSLLAFNAWGALLIGLIAAQIGAGVISGNATTIFIASIPFNFYAIVTLMMVLFVILSGKDFAIMRRYEEAAKAKQSEYEALQPKSMGYMLVPIITMLLVMIGALTITGDGDMLQGSGSTSVFYAVVISLFVSFIYYMLTKAMSKKSFFDNLYGGISDMIPIVMILIFAFEISGVIKELEIGLYIASILSDTIHAIFIAPLIFVVAGVVAFSTGTSWGTFSIMMPIGIAIASATGAPLELVIGAVVSGGIFGDHCSIISDTTIISAMATKCDLVSHVKTQLPYALSAGAIAFVLFLVFGFFMV